MVDFYNEQSIYLQRQTAGGADVGNRENLLKLVGGTIAWNQLSPVGGGSVTIPAGHVYYFEQTNVVSKYDYDVTAVCDENSVLIDLTIMFGKEIADYVYALEEAQLGDGVAFIKPFIERADKSYNAGELVSVKTSAHVTKDANAATLGTYPIDNIELRGKLKLDADNKLYYDGDEYVADGTVKRKYAAINLGTATASMRTNYTNLCFYGVTITGGKDLNVTFDTAVLPVPLGRTAGSFDNAAYIGTASRAGANLVYIGFPVGTTLAQARAAMAGKMFVYELATSTSESASPIPNPQIVDANGTEEFIDARDVPMLVSQASMFYQDSSIPEAYSSDVIMEIPEQFKRPVVLAFLEAWRAQLREVEDVIGTTREKCGIEGAIGAQLDLFGASIGVMRNGKADEEYRQIIQMKLQTIVGNASPKDVITTLQKFENITNYSAGSGVISVEFQHAVDFTEFDVQRTLSPAGVDVNITTVV